LWTFTALCPRVQSSTNHNKGITVIFTNQIEQLGGRVASDLGYPEVYDYGMALIIHEHQDRLDLSDYNAVLDFVTDFLDDETII